jgi:uncharacterized protein YjbI with pentapeptide repeats
MVLRQFMDLFEGSPRVIDTTPEFTLTPITGSEFLERILAGQRNFNRHELTAEHDLTQLPTLYVRTIAYLREAENASGKQRLSRHPFSINDAVFANLIAPGLHLPYVRAQHIDLTDAVLTHSVLHHGILSHAVLHNTQLSYANLEYAHMGTAKTNERTSFDYARVNGVDRPHYGTELPRIYVLMVRGHGLELERGKIIIHQQFRDHLPKQYLAYASHFSSLEDACNHGLPPFYEMTHTGNDPLRPLPRATQRWKTARLARTNGLASVENDTHYDSADSSDPIIER